MLRFWNHNVLQSITLILVWAVLFIAVAVQAEDATPYSRFYIAVEGGPVWQSKCDVRIPGDGGTEFSFKELTGGGPYAAGRFSLGWRPRARHALRLAVAPLRVEGKGSFDRPVEFAGTVFAADTTTEGRYKFDTYRLGYRYRLLQRSTWQFRTGATLLVRDAEIELEQADARAADSNVGLVPLLSLSARWSFAERWGAELDFDGLAGGPGRALDLALKLYFDVNDHWQIAAGYRTLEGGVDNEDVYNFSWFNYALVSIRYRF